jgi:glucose/arabinose dehydrogenase
MRRLLDLLLLFQIVLQTRKHSVLVRADAAPAKNGGVGGPGHLAHAVPGEPLVLIDWDKDGVENGTLDASESHSHFFKAGPPFQSAYIVEYLWKMSSTGQELLRSANSSMSGAFYMGTTLLSLQVTDNYGNANTGWTYVIVKKAEPWAKDPPYPSSASPPSCPTYGGTPVTISGYGFYNNPEVYFGSERAQIVNIVSDRVMVVSSPASTDNGSIDITVNNGFGNGSRSVKFDYYVSNLSNIEFREDTFKNANGTTFQIQEITSLKLGPDGIYYAGSLDGFLYSIVADKEFVIKSFCKSENVGPHRSVLGLAFNPYDSELPAKLYITTSVLFWKAKRTGADWNNGKVEVWSTATSKGSCLSHMYDLVTGLPVSNVDHGVNALDFDLNGDMFLSVAGSTNAGVETDGDGVGGVPESPLSSALLRLKLSKGEKFNGSIMYDQTSNPATATVVGGDVSVYAYGLRNCFGFTRHSNKRIYAMDNGPNAGFGYASTTCTEMDKSKSVNFQDSLNLIQEGAYYGHPNRNRGRQDPRQCTFKAGWESDDNYTAGIYVFDSSTNGIVEYTANTFDSQLRQNLFVSRLSWGGPGQVQRVVLNNQGDKVIRATPVYKDGGTCIVMSPYGDLIMPMIKQSYIRVMRAVYKPKTAVSVLAVWPRRGPSQGGNYVMVSGHGFGEGMVLTFGGKGCISTNTLASDGTSVWCKVPPNTGGALVPVKVTIRGVSSNEYLGGDYEYMF